MKYSYKAGCIVEREGGLVPLNGLKTTDDAQLGE